MTSAPIALYQQIPTPYAWFGVRPELFDAPARGSRYDMVRQAAGFLVRLHPRRAHPPRPGDRRLQPGLHHQSPGHHLRPASSTGADKLGQPPQPGQNQLPRLDLRQRISLRRSLHAVLAARRTRALTSRTATDATTAR